MLWEKVTLIGVGLLGGSLGLALRQNRMAREVVGYVRRPASVDECVAAKAVHIATCDLTAAVADADLVILCTPVAQMKPLMRVMASSLKPGALVTDVGSVKCQVVQELEPICLKAGARFVGSHPMAGSEKTGVAAARNDLFKNAVCVVTPSRKTDPNAVETTLRLWRGVGCRVSLMTPAHHDLLVSRSSHLPHVVAAGLVNMVLSDSAPPEQASLCANGFRDTTRIASGSPEMWRDIVLANNQFLSKGIRQFCKTLEKLATAAERNNGRQVEAFFRSAKGRRDVWAKLASSDSPE